MNPTPQQYEAATAPGSVAVTAGAGTGKTRMLAWRYMHHIEVDGFSPLQIVAVTFTDKAADELRSRIRKTIAESALSADVFAQVEASQISTIHALAARICRDFYHIASIPPDFEILDDAESPMWVTAQFEKAMAAVEPAIVDELGYTWLHSALTQLMADPLASEAAFSRSPSAWPAAIEDAVQTAISELRATEAWESARGILPRYSGASGDTLEAARLQALGAIANIEAGRAICESAAELVGLRASGGVAGNWATNDEREVVRVLLRDLKNAVKDREKILKLSHGPLDVELGRQTDLLRRAFEEASEYLQTAKLKERRLDFSDLEIYALKALRDPTVVAHYSQRWRAFMVDEFQDTNPVQAEILRLLTAGTKLTVVGDEKQSIYGFRGAESAVFGEFRAGITAAGGKTVPLTKTYRSHKPIVKMMNEVFAPVLGELRQDLEAERDEPKPGISDPFITVNIVEKVDGTYKHQQQVVEARFIADQVNEITASGDIKYGDIAILSRAWAPLDIYADVLAAAGIPAVHAGGGSLLTTREALDAVAVIDFLAYPHDDIPLATILRSPFFAVSDKSLFYFADELRGTHLSWWDGLAQTNVPELAHAHSILSQVTDARSRKSPSELLKYLDQLTGYRAVVANLPHGPRREADWDGMLELVRKQEHGGRPDAFTLSRFLKQLIQAEIEIPRPPLNARDAVSLMTIHKAKGLEWPVVFIPDLSRDAKSNTLEYLIIDPELGVAFKIESDGPDRAEPAIYILLKKRKTDREFEESKHVLYVAMTRAEDKVIISATKEKGHAIDLLRPGLDAAGMIDRPIPYQDELAIPPAPGEPAPFDTPETMQVEPLRLGLTSIPVTALSTYAKCPAQFHFRYVLGHPGLGEGPATASSIGTLAHSALELELDAVEELRGKWPDAPEDQIEAALELAHAFRTDAAFADLQGVEVQKEVPFRLKIGRVTLEGKIDVVGPDFVLDYKTDSKIHPDEHRFQLWVYAKALGKSEALIAYLRHKVLHRFDKDQLDQLDVAGAEVIDAIANGLYFALPSEAACRFCSYHELCDQRYRGESIE
jgi:ATP-dependent helicase/nuclease subunit A